ncbi:MAG: undecaprenyl/decaprenyl-phosphate alpha-N-acetylglucosaminyl 1-phosphate transferase [Crocinitomicaceae bacterium]|nr:undecaprenyl/decaprenyl-phosphate alpha-N-acetylglucosaminyl 1-phosphate transferase [Crocinitomicaceae bacterium]
MINKLLLSFAGNLGIRNKNNVVIRWSSVSKPSLGGISFFISFFASILVYSVIFGESDIYHNLRFLGFLGGSFLAFFMGLADDAYDTKPLIKLFTQILCGVLMIATGSYINVFQYEILNYALTIIWVIGIMNSLNMLDNMDGITAVTSLQILLSIIFIIYIFDWNYLINITVLISLVGAIIGFLPYNLNPSKMFMGDTGSQFLGFVLAYVSIDQGWNLIKRIDPAEHYSLLAIIFSFSLVLIIFTVTIVDTTFVTINRIRKGQSPMVGGKDHTTHHLSYLGLSDKQIGYRFMILNLLSLILALLAVWIKVKFDSYLGILFVLYPIVLILYFYKIKHQVEVEKNEKI